MGCFVPDCPRLVDDTPLPPRFGPQTGRRVPSSEGVRGKWGGCQIHWEKAKMTVLWKLANNVTKKYVRAGSILQGTFQDREETTVSPTPTPEAPAKAHEIKTLTRQLADCGFLAK